MLKWQRRWLVLACKSRGAFEGLPQQPGAVQRHVAGHRDAIPQIAQSCG